MSTFSVTMALESLQFLDFSIKPPFSVTRLSASMVRREILVDFIGHIFSSANSGHLNLFAIIYACKADSRLMNAPDFQHIKYK